MMRRTRSNQRPSSRAVAAKTRRRAALTPVALTEPLEGRTLLSSGGGILGGLPGSVLPYVFGGPLAGLGTHGANHASTKGTAGPVAAPARRPRPAAARATVSSPPPVAPAQTEADRPT